MWSPTANTNQDTDHCSICLEAMMPSNNEENRRLDCSHIFHDRCISQWVALSNRCPLCRSYIDGTDHDEQPFIINLSQGHQIVFLVPEHFGESIPINNILSLIENLFNKIFFDSSLS